MLITPVIMGQMYNIYNITLVNEHLLVSRPNPTFIWLILLSLMPYNGPGTSHNNHRLGAYTKVVCLPFVSVLPGKQNDGSTAATAVTTAATAATTPVKPASKFHFYSAVTMYMVVIESSVTQHSFNAR